MATILDVAKLSGFSKSTVSLVLMNDPRVKLETREKIKAAMKQLNYRNNEIARNLAMRKNSRIVLFIVADMYNRFHTDLISNISDLLEASGYMTVVCNGAFDSEKQIRYFKMAQENLFSGVIYMGHCKPEIAAQISEMSCPVVMLNTKAIGIELDMVFTDSYKAAYDATKLLIDKGHRRILHAAGSHRSFTHRQIQNGYSAALEEAGILQEPHDICELEISWRSGYDFVKQFVEMQGDYTAIFFARYQLMAGFDRGWSEIGKTVPDDISFVFLGTDTDFESTPRKATGFLANAAKTAKHSTDILLSRMENVDLPKQHILIEYDIYEGESIADLNLSGASNERIVFA